MSASSSAQPPSRVVAVCDPQPLFRLGLSAVLVRAGYEAVEVDEPHDWEPVAAPFAFVLTVAGEERATGRPIAGLRARWPGSLIVAVLPKVNADTFGSLLTQGADVVVGRDETPERILQMLCAGAQECVLVPVGIARHLAEEASKVSRAPELGDQQLSWLKMLAEGRSVTEVAQAAGYSRRQMHRELSNLYARLGAATRAEALIEATRAGLL